MFNIHIIALGKLKESYWKNAEAEYQKRLGPYAKVSLSELPETSFKDLGEKERVQIDEAAKIEKHLKPGDVVIALHERGKQMTSPALANFLKDTSMNGQRIVFVIGGPLGLHPTFLEKIDLQLSLSALTFPHQMVRTILLEQLYRAETIVAGKQYHY